MLTQINSLFRQSAKVLENILSPMQWQHSLCYCEKRGFFYWASEWKYMAVLGTVLLPEKLGFGRLTSSIWSLLLMSPVLEGWSRYQLATLLLMQHPLQTNNYSSGGLVGWEWETADVDFDNSEPPITSPLCSHTAPGTLGVYWLKSHHKASQSH